MKIAFVTNLRTHYVKRLFEILSEKHDIDFYFTGGYEQYWTKGNRETDGNYKSYSLRGLLLGSKLKLTPGLFCLPARGYQAYVKTIDDRFALLLTFLIAKLTRKPFILWAGLWHHPVTVGHRLTRRFMNLIYRKSDAVIVYGEHVKKYLLGLGVAEDRIFCAPHAVDNTQFNAVLADEEKTHLKRTRNLSAGPVVLYVGRLEECKGIDYLLEAMKRIKMPELNFILVGTGPKKEALLNAQKELTVRCCCIDHVPNEELYRYYAIADIFILPSITTDDFKEPWGLVVNEAMNQGCVVIATDAVGAAAGGLVEDKVTGFIIPERDAEAIKDAIEGILGNSVKKAEMKAKAKEKISRWTQDVTADGFLRGISSAVHRIQKDL